jgi:cation transport ATPase
VGVVGGHDGREAADQVLANKDAPDLGAARARRDPQRHSSGDTANRLGRAWKEHRDTALERFEAFPGKGVRGSVAGRLLVLGNAKLLAELGVSANPFALRAEAVRRDGGTAL